MVAIDEKSVRGSDAVRRRRRTQPVANNLYQGMTLDVVTGLYYERERDYSPSLGRWTEQDPAQYINGANTYQFVDSSPVGNVDAEGLHVYYVGGPIHYLPDHRFYRNYYYEGSFGSVDLPGSPGGSVIAEVAHAIADMTDVGATVNNIIHTTDITTATYNYKVVAYWEDTRVFTYKCIENGHPTDVKWQSTTKGKELRVLFFPVQHWEGEGTNPLTLGDKTSVDASMTDFRKSLTDLATEIFDAVHGE